MAPDAPHRRPGRPVADAPIERLVSQPEEVALRWLVALLSQVELHEAPGVVTEPFTRDGPRVCSAALRALAEDSDLRRLERDGALWPLVSRVGEMTGSAAPAHVLTAVDTLHDVLWAQLRGELRGTPDAELVAELAARLTRVCALIRDAGLARAGGGPGLEAVRPAGAGARFVPPGPPVPGAAGGPPGAPGPAAAARPSGAAGGPPGAEGASGAAGGPPGAEEMAAAESSEPPAAGGAAAPESSEPPVAEEVPAAGSSEPPAAGGVAAPESSEPPVAEEAPAAGSSEPPPASEPATAAEATTPPPGRSLPLWVEALDEEIQAARAAFAPLSLLLAELEDADRIATSAGSERASEAFGEFSLAVRRALRRQDILVQESVSRAWVIARETARAGAHSLGARIAESVGETPSLSGSPLVASVGVAVLSEDGVTGAQLMEAAEEARFAASARGIEVSRRMR